MEKALLLNIEKRHGVSMQSKESKRLPIDADDVLNVLKLEGDTLKYERCIQFLQNREDLVEMLTGFDISSM